MGTIGLTYTRDRMDAVGGMAAEAVEEVYVMKTRRWLQQWKLEVSAHSQYSVRQSRIAIPEYSILQSRFAKQSSYYLIGTRKQCKKSTKLGPGIQGWCVQSLSNILFAIYTPVKHEGTR